MRRREFMKAIGAPAIASSLAAMPSVAADREAEPRPAALSQTTQKTWLFWDWWHIEHQDNVGLCQGKATWCPDGTYEDPTFDYLGCWPTVWRDRKSKQWRMLYCNTGFPLTLMGAESDDGIHWRPTNRPEVKPPGEKYAPNHLFTVLNANVGLVYLDPMAADGRAFELYCIQRGGPAAARTRLDPNSYFHEIVAGEGAKPYVADQLMATSADGLHWELDKDARWGQPPRHPDPPINCYYDSMRQRHVMITRPGWGDRRIAMQTSRDAREWSDLELIMQPDSLDPPQVQMYGMPVIPYHGQFVGLLWMAHFSNSRPLERFNQLWGPIDCQLTYSFDGEHFQRGLRKPFIECNSPGEPGSGVVYPTCLVEHDDELRIYSAATPDLHHQYAQTQFERKGKNPPGAVILHTLRKDGFVYLASRGHWAELTTKPVAPFDPELTLDVQVSHGEVAFQAADLNTRPISGFTFGDCVPIKEADSVDCPIRWKNKDVSELLGKVIRLQVRLRHARLYALRGSFHWLDALDVAMLEDGKTIDTSLFDF